MLADKGQLIQQVEYNNNPNFVQAVFQRAKQNSGSFMFAWKFGSEAIPHASLL